MPHLDTIMAMDYRTQILAAREHDPEAPANAIATQIGVSREYVRQVLKAAGLPTTTTRSVRRGTRLGGPRKSRAVKNHWLGRAAATHLVGASCELIAAADLIGLGWHVYRSIRVARGPDLMICCDPHRLRVEVKAGRIVQGRRIAPRRPDSAHEAYAVVYPDHSVEYSDLPVLHRTIESS